MGINVLYLFLFFIFCSHSTPFCVSASIVWGTEPMLPSIDDSIFKSNDNDNNNNSTDSHSTRASFAIIADIQYADQKPSSHRFYLQSLDKLRNSLSYFNRYWNRLQLQFVANLGDLTDKRAIANRPPVLSIFDDFVRNRSSSSSSSSSSSLPLIIIRHVLGDHDFMGSRSPKNVHEDLTMPSPYYFFDVTKTVRVYILNTNEISLYGATNPAQAEEAKIILKRLKSKRARNAQPFNAAIGPEQLRWLKESADEYCVSTTTTTTITREQRSIIVLGHHPVAPELFEVNLWNDDELREVILSIDCARVYFSGHAHVLRHDVLRRTSNNNNGVHFVTVPGMVQFQNTSFGDVHVFPDYTLFRFVFWGRVGYLKMFHHQNKCEIEPVELIARFRREHEVVAIKQKRVGRNVMPRNFSIYVSPKANSPSSPIVKTLPNPPAVADDVHSDHHHQYQNLYSSTSSSVAITADSSLFDDPFTAMTFVIFFVPCPVAFYIRSLRR